MVIRTMDKQTNMSGMGEFTLIPVFHPFILWKKERKKERQAFLSSTTDPEPITTQNKPDTLNGPLPPPHMNPVTSITPVTTPQLKLQGE